MPEGHTVHRAAREHTKLFAGAPVCVTSPQGRFDASVIDGRTLKRVEAYGKHWFAWFEGNALIHVHLGLFGKWWTHTDGFIPPARDSVRMRWLGANGAIDLTGPTACVVGTPELYDSVVKRLGPDPLRKDAQAARFVDKVARSKKSIGQLLMDQSVAAGVGNVYRAEALFVRGIWPERLGTDVGAAEAEAIWTVLVGMLRDGVKTGKIVTVPKAERPPDASRDGKVNYVYKRELCLRCGTPIRRWDMAGRWCYACPTCQPR